MIMHKLSTLTITDDNDFTHKIIQINFDEHQWIKLTSKQVDIEHKNILDRFISSDAEIQLNNRTARDSLHGHFLKTFLSLKKIANVSYY